MAQLTLPPPLAESGRLAYDAMAKSGHCQLLSRPGSFLEPRPNKGLQLAELIAGLIGLIFIYQGFIANITVGIHSPQAGVRHPHRLRLASLSRLRRKN